MNDVITLHVLLLNVHLFTLNVDMVVWGYWKFDEPKDMKRTMTIISIFYLIYIILGAISIKGCFVK